ncbi:MAG TPA: imidazole glycerol phosphate synthase subunit HisH [Syntrophomonadaceae bacterium]|nr:imidazole glycerol phosphate synthase subunit HisH [Syntrophomonadaceae bacterium]
MIAIIDYGMGNLASVKNAFIKLGYSAFTTDKAEEILQARGVVLPGVGAFGDCMNNIRQLGLDQTIHQVVERKTPFLGICLGFQVLFSESEENGLHRGLDILPGRVVRFELPRQYKVPQMGWNQVESTPDSRLFKGIPPGSHFYFVHSYYVVPDDPSCIAGRSQYGQEFVCAAERGNLMATQFHPEKSSRLGLQILKNFGELMI